jgi:hypothetical protein
MEEIFYVLSDKPRLRFENNTCRIIDNIIDAKLDQKFESVFGTASGYGNNIKIWRVTGELTFEEMK